MASNPPQILIKADVSLGSLADIPRALNWQGVRHFFHRSYYTAVGQLASHDRRLAMPLQRGEVQVVMLEKNRMQLFEEVQFFLDWARRD